ncbi:class I SAM-dependent methyltransferase [Pseudomonadota bacterium]
MREQVVSVVAKAAIHRLLAMELPTFYTREELDDALRRKVGETAARKLIERDEKGSKLLIETPQHHEFAASYYEHKEVVEGILANLVKFLDILDLGNGIAVMQDRCRTGLELRILSQFYEGTEIGLLGYDQRKGMVDRGEQRSRGLGNVVIYQSSTENPRPEEGDLADVLFSCGNLSFQLDDEEATVKGIEGMKQRVKPGGWLALTCIGDEIDTLNVLMRRRALNYTSSNVVYVTEEGKEMFMHYYIAGEQLRQVTFEMDINPDILTGPDVYNVFALFCAERSMQIKPEAKRFLTHDYFEGFIESGSLAYYGEDPWTYIVQDHGRKTRFIFQVAMSKPKFERFCNEMKGTLYAYTQIRDGSFLEGLDS